MFQISELAKNVFKFPVCARLATDKLDEKGNTVIAEAWFIGKFQSVSVEEGTELAKKITAVKTGDYEGMVETISEQLSRVFLGFEKHPKHPMPFKDGQEDAVSSPETIKQLLNSKEVSDAIQAAYNEARRQDIATKNSRK